MDDFSAIFELPTGGQPEALLVIRMHERHDPVPPEFEADQVQKNLRWAFSKMRDERIMEYEQGLLARQAYTWLNPSLRSMGQPQQLGPRASGAP